SGSMDIYLHETGPFSSCAAVDVPEAECLVLQDLYTSTSGSSWYENTGWFVTDEVCSWYGIECYSGNVEGISLWSNDLTGSLTTDFTNLSYLWFLDIEYNWDLGGDISTIIGNMPTGLGYLFLGGNNFSGTIPA
ncbi:MAG: hypothetical protein GWO08_11385, partial [Gammaproteobacteria bacterium]|nr:hypothetical protein [Gammaproteobacteria bacterium]NIW44304.1 hypothetical protein [Gammaproteobacteria bacterium]NIX59186.1 hypothetical protein [candidate division Zixibacteria bacterium]